MRTYNNIERPDFTPRFIKSLKPDEIFVFGSNLAGAHGGGAARIAVENFGAIWGQGVGLQGQCYAIPTMQGGVETIKPYVDEFIDFAKQHKELFFYVTRIGCGIAGFSDKEIAPLFKDAKALENVALPKSFVEYKNNLNLNIEAVNEMIECQGVYEIMYRKDANLREWHISNIGYSKHYGNSCITAYCREVHKELTFKISNIKSVQPYWINIKIEDAKAPHDGVYLIARMNPGMGGGIDYNVYAIQEGESLVRKDYEHSLPFAYHYIHQFGKLDEKWVSKEIIMKKWQYEEIPAHQDGIPIIAYKSPTKPGHFQYCIGNGCGCYGNGEVWGGVSKNSDISVFFQDPDTMGYIGWSEKWEGFKIIGFVMICEYDTEAIPHYVWQWIRQWSKEHCDF